MRAFVFALLFAVPAAEPIITPDGLAPVYIGMTQAEPRCMRS
jgi:hypothetical protein